MELELGVGMVVVVGVGRAAGWVVGFGAWVEAAVVVGWGSGSGFGVLG